MSEEQSTTPSVREEGTPDSLSAPTLLKRRVSSSSFEENSHKRIKEDGDPLLAANQFCTDGDADFLDEFAEQLFCGCCSELVYKPVLVMPCQHFFCGR